MTNNFIKRLLTSIILGPLVLYTINKGSIYFLSLLSIIFILVLYEILNLKIIIYKILLIVIIIIFIFSSYYLSINEENKLFLYFAIFISWLSDIGGYLFGKLFKGKKINFISPKKTYIGFFGSILISQFLIIYLDYFNLIEKNLFYKFIFITANSTLVIIGDLFFSYVKRVNKIKDYSDILPGHGGILDRIDGLIFVTIFNYIYILIR